MLSTVAIEIRAKTQSLQSWHLEICFHVKHWGCGACIHCSSEMMYSWRLLFLRHILSFVNSYSNKSAKLGKHECSIMPSICFHHMFYHASFYFVDFFPFSFGSHFFQGQHPPTAHPGKLTDPHPPHFWSTSKIFKAACHCRFCPKALIRLVAQRVAIVTVPSAHNDSNVVPCCVMPLGISRN